MTSWEIILVLGGIPLGVMVVLGLLTLGPTLRRRPRYRPGEPWNHPPVWWMADPRALQAGRAEQHSQGQHSRGQHRPGGRADRGGCRGDW